MSTGEQLRDEGIQRALENTDEDVKDAVREAFHSFRQFRRGWYVSCNSFRIWLQEHYPEIEGRMIPNAWGGVWLGFVKSGFIEPTDIYTKTMLPQCHARITKMYEVK